MAIGKKNIRELLLMVRARVHTKGGKPRWAHKNRIDGQGANRLSLTIQPETLQFDMVGRTGVYVSVIHGRDTGMPIVIAALRLADPYSRKLGFCVLGLVGTRAEKNLWLVGDVILQHQAEPNRRPALE